MERGIYTQNEILTQTEAWEDALNAVNGMRDALLHLAHGNYDQILFTGCGSTYYLSLAGAALFQKLSGKLARAVPGGELLINPETVLTDGKTLLIAVSRSGSTTETLHAVEQFRLEKRGPVVAITNYGDQPLAGLADEAVIIEKGREESIAQTRSFASMYVAVTAMAAIFAGDDSLYQSLWKLPEKGEKLISAYKTFAREIGENLDFDRFYYLGSGACYGLACETNLKMKEMTITHSEAFHFLEFRHGPMSMVTTTTFIAGLLSDANRAHEQKVLTEMKALGATVAGFGESGTDVSFDSGIAECARGVLYLPVLQLMSYYRAMAKGLDPDHPNHLSAVVTLDTL